MQIILLGTGTPVLDSARQQSAFLVDIDGEKILFDAGCGVTSQMAKAGVEPRLVDAVFITHHHYDHNADYPCFLLTRWNHHNGKEVPLHIWGPPPTASITERLIGESGAFADDWKARVNHPASQRVHVERGGTLPRPGPAFIATDAGPGLITEGAGWKVTATWGKHADPWLKSLAYRVDSAEGSVAFTGDAVPTEGLGRLAQGVGTLVVNCWDHSENMGPDFGISGTLEAAGLAREAGARRLVLAHSLARLTQPGSRERAVVDIARIYAGEIVFGEEGLVLDV